jgi:hypothetical protein
MSFSSSYAFCIARPGKTDRSPTWSQSMGRCATKRLAKWKMCYEMIGRVEDTRVALLHVLLNGLQLKRGSRVNYSLHWFDLSILERHLYRDGGSIWFKQYKFRNQIIKNINSYLILGIKLIRILIVTCWYVAEMMDIIQIILSFNFFCFTYFKTCIKMLYNNLMP